MSNPSVVLSQPKNIQDPIAPYGWGRRQPVSLLSKQQTGDKLKETHANWV